MYDDPNAEDQLVERLHSMLAQALLSGNPQPFDSPVTVAEIYQDLVPYRSVRTALGFQMNADYEHTLLRMLAGEGGRVRLEPAEARDELQTELEAPNPNVGLFRKFAACDVWVTPDFNAAIPVPVEEPRIEAAGPEHVPEPAAASPPESGNWGADPGAVDRDIEEWDASLPELILDDVVPADAPAPEPPDRAPQPAPETSARLESSRAEPITPQPETATMFETDASPGVRAASHDGNCAFCASDLPAGRVVKFCPFCGADQRLQPCGACAEPLEPGWQFCIACGTRQDTA